MAEVHPFPLAWLPRWSLAHAALGRSLARRLAPLRPRAERRPLLDARFWELLGSRLEATPLVPSVCERAALERARRGTVVAVLWVHPAVGPMAALLDRTLALVLAARAQGLGVDEARVQALGGAFGPAQEGALSLLCAQCAVLLSEPSPPPLLRGVTTVLSDALEALEADACALWPWRVQLGDDAGEVTLVLDARRLLSAPPAPDAGLVRALDTVAVQGALVAARDTLDAGLVAALAPGDVLLAGPGLALDAQGRVSGALVLALGGLDLPVCIEDARCSVTGPAQPRRATVNPSEHESDDTDTTHPPALDTAQLAQLPVEVELVLARGRYTVGEVGAWRVGEVLALPAALGEPVELVAGGRVVARGELVAVEGSVGVRITALA